MFKRKKRPKGIPPIAGKEVKEKELAAVWEKAAIIDALPDALIVLDLNGVVVYANPAFTKMFGHKPEERIGKSFDGFGESLRAEDIERFMKLLGKLIEVGHVEPVETVIRAKDGRGIPTSVTYSLIKDAKGNPKNIVAMLRDTSETKKLISDLEEKKILVNNIFASTIDSIAIVNLDGAITDISKISLERSGYSKEEMTGDSATSLVSEEDRAKFPDLIREVIEKGLVRNVEMTEITKDGRKVPIMFNATLMRDAKEEPTGIVAIARDITETKKLISELEEAKTTLEERVAERTEELSETVAKLTDSRDATIYMLSDLEKTTKALEEVKNYTDSIIKSMTDTLVVVSPEGNIQTVNHATCAMLGYKEKELIGQPVGKILAEEEDSLFKRSGIDDLIKKKFISNVEKTYLAKDGRKIPVLFSGSVMSEGDGKIQGIVCMAQDITEHKQMDEQLLQSEKLAGMGLLASSIAHELGNPLSIMSSTLQYVRDTLLDTGNRQLIEAIDIIMDSIGQTHELLGSLSQFTDSRRPRFESTDLRRILSRMLSFIHKEAEIHKIKVSHQLDENLPNCQIDFGEIKQLLLNLFKNAIEAMPNGGELHVRMHLLDSKDAVCIEVSDTGDGISETNLRSIFRPFYSTKPDGTGLGLSFCRHVVEEHGGEITVKSELSKGSTFSVILPLRQKGTDKSDESSPSNNSDNR